jgi:hypothetical protein
MSHWNFEKYATLHMKKHEIQEDLMKHEDKGTNEGTDVCHLMGGIKTDKLNAAQASIHADFIRQSRGGKMPLTHMNAELSVMSTDDIEDCEISWLDTQNNVFRSKHKAQSQVPGSQDSNSPNHAKSLRMIFIISTGMILMMPMMASDHKQSLPYEWWVMLA